ELLETWLRLHRERPNNIYPILEVLAIAGAEEEWDAVRLGVESLRASYYQLPDRVEEALDELLLAGEGDLRAARRARTRGLVVRTVLRATRRFKRDAEELRLPESRGGGEEITEFASDELRAARDRLAAGNDISLLGPEPATLALDGLVKTLPAGLGDFDGDGLREAVVWAGAGHPAPVILKKRPGAAWEFEAS